MMAWGNSHVMNIYCSLYSSIDQYIADENAIIHPEPLLKFHLEKNKMKVNRTRFSFSLMRNALTNIKK